MFKICRLCNIELPVSRFSIRDKNKGTLRTECKTCLANERKKSPRHGMWHKENKEKVTNYNMKLGLKRNYGMSYQEYVDLLDAQGGMCAICGTDKFMGVGKRAHVDHCHATGKVRGLLCNLCNVGIGALKENTETLRNALDYIEKWEDYRRALVQTDEKPEASRTAHLFTIEYASIGNGEIK